MRSSAWLEPPPGPASVFVEKESVRLALIAALKELEAAGERRSLSRPVRRFDRLPAGPGPVRR
ncbi:hypothetical protein ACFLIM_44925 [Nonomuraea sp. M3C6]|uniref:Uncharacterized protein n=1 Tax=Nonomuraea marmarensis TaxID=3351344 RepID=A0ABW7AVC9_9ACTN